MSGGGLIIDLSNLSQPATTLINRVSDAVGGIAKPWQMKRVARAEAEVEEIRAATQIKLQEQEERALHRMIADETRKQENIERITYEAAQNVGENAKPDDVEEDWLNHFFEKSKNVSDAEMRSVWAKLLSGEAAKPGSFSKRAIDLVGSLDKRDAELFTALCTFTVHIGSAVPLIYDEKDTIYSRCGINFGKLTHLEDIGLVKFQTLSGFQRNEIPQHFLMFYFGVPIFLHFPDEKNSLQIGKVIFTDVGRQLTTISGAQPSGEFLQYICDRLVKQGVALSTPPNAKEHWLRVNMG